MALVPVLLAGTVASDTYGAEKAIGNVATAHGDDNTGAVTVLPAGSAVVRAEIRSGRGPR